MGGDPTHTLLLIMIGVVLLSAGVPASSAGTDHPTPALAGQGTHEVVPDPRRPLIYQVGLDSEHLFFLNASTGEIRWNETLSVGPSPTSIDFSADGNFRYSVTTDTPVLLASNNGVEGDSERVVVDWSERMMYVSGLDPYGI